MGPETEREQNAQERDGDTGHLSVESGAAMSAISLPQV